MLTRLEVANYKSLERLDLQLGALNLFVGPNGGGKSNILDALAFVKAVVVEAQDVGQALRARGGYGAVVWGGDPQRDLQFRLSFEGQVTYSLQMGCQAQSVVVKAETLEEGEQVIPFRDRSDHWAHGESSGVPAPERAFLPQFSSVVPKVAAAQRVLDSMARWAFYRFALAEMRPPQAVRKEYRLTEKGNNLSTVLHALYSDQSPFFHEVSETFRTAVRSVDALLAPLAEQPGYTQVAVKERGVASPVTAWGMSDGNLLSLALSVALLTPDPPELVALEAPDTEIHPRLMEHLADMLKIAARKTQVLATTHNPYLLDFLPPDSLIIVEKEGGKTVCTRVATKKQLLRIMRHLRPGEAWYSGHLGGLP